MPERLVEWIEMQFITGADIITIYTYYVPRKMQQVLKYYIKKGSVTVVSSYICSNERYYSENLNYEY